MSPLFVTIALATAVQAAPLPLPAGKLRATLDESPAATIVTFSPENPRPPVSLHIDWLNQNPPPTAFSIEADPKLPLVESTHNLGSTHITRTILATPGAVFLHFIADKPGDLSFRATLKLPDGETSAIEDRRELAWSSSDAPATKARAWIIPFESDVESDNGAILLRGEGECLVVFSFTPRDSAENPLSGLWKRLSDRHDPAGNPPDPVKIWHSLIENARRP